MADREPNTRHNEARAPHTVSNVPQVAPAGRTERFDDAWDAEQQDINIVPLTRAEAEKLFGPKVSRPSRVTPFRVVMAQMVLSLVATLVWWLFYEPPGAAALSAFLGGRLVGCRAHCSRHV